MAAVQVKDLNSSEALLWICVHWLSQNRDAITSRNLEEQTGRCHETVRRALRRFVDEGWLMTEKRADPYSGVRLPALYRLSPDAPALPALALPSAA